MREFKTKVGNRQKLGEKMTRLGGKAGVEALGSESWKSLRLGRGRDARAGKVKWGQAWTQLRTQTSD